jgi:ABC-type Mn2+/Zn2+ transport system permease subunit
MTRITTIGIILAVLGVIAYLLDCPYGVAIIVVGAIAAVIGFFVRTARSTTTTGV